MLKELFDALTAHAAKVCQPTVLRPPGEPDDVYYLCVPGAAPECRTAAPSPLKSVAGSVTALCAVVADWAVDQEAPQVWFSRAGVFAWRDDDTRRDSISYPLTFTRQLQTLQTLKITFDQKAILRLLRIDLHGCLGTCEGLIGTLRKVVFKSDGAAVGTVVQGKASMTREMRAEVTGEREIPEVVRFDVQVFEEPPFRVTVDCALDVNPESTQPFALIPLPGELERGIREAEEYVGTLVRSELGRLLNHESAGDGDSPTVVPVYYGKP